MAVDEVDAVGKLDQLEVAKVETGDHLAALGQHHLVETGGGVAEEVPVGDHFTHGVGADRHAGDHVVAVRVGHGGGLLRVELAVAVEVHVNRHPGEARLVGVVHAVAVEVLELHAPQLAVAGVEEVVAEQGLAIDIHKVTALGSLLVDTEAAVGRIGGEQVGGAVAVEVDRRDRPERRALAGEERVVRAVVRARVPHAQFAVG